MVSGHGPDADAQAASRPNLPVSCAAADCWTNSTQYLHSLGNDDAFLVTGAKISANFHQPGSLVQVNSQCRGRRSSILAAGVDGALARSVNLHVFARRVCLHSLSVQLGAALTLCAVAGLVVSSETALNAAPSTGPQTSGGDPAGCPLVATGTNSTVWTARNIHIDVAAGYTPNNALVMLQEAAECRLCVDVDVAASAVLAAEPVRDYARGHLNQSLWTMLSVTGVHLPTVLQLPAARSFEQSPTFEWHVGPEAAFRRKRGVWLTTRGQEEVGALALSVDLGATPSLAPVLVNSVLMPSTVVAGLSANLNCTECTLHFVARVAADGVENRAQTEQEVVSTSDWVISNAVNHTCGSWSSHTFPIRLPAQPTGTLQVGVLIRSTQSLEAPSVLGTLAGFSLRRLGAARQF
jgi:hypothetical protein